jgi:hypothetical protein
MPTADYGLTVNFLPVWGKNQAGNGLGTEFYLKKFSAKDPDQVITPARGSNGRLIAVRFALLDGAEAPRRSCG